MPLPLIATFTSNDASNRILVCSSNNGIEWTGGVETGQFTKLAPCQAFFNGRYWGLSPPGLRWASWTSGFWSARR